MQAITEEIGALLEKGLKISDVAKVLNINIQDVQKYKGCLLFKKDKRVYKTAIFKVREIGGLNDRQARKIVKEIMAIYKIKD